MSADQARQPAGVPTGGQFATGARPEAGLALAPERHATVRVTAVAELSTFGVEPLPVWPAQLPEPSVSYAWDDDGLLETTMVTGGHSIIVFGTPSDPQLTIDELPEEFKGIPEDVKEPLRAYGARLHDNIHTLTNQATYPLHTDELRAAVLSLASGGDGRPHIVDDPQEQGFVAPTDRGARRAEAGLKAWFATTQVDESTLQDAMTDLLHLARAKGITPAQFGGILNRAQGMYRDELENPEA